ncbi:metallophosphoesterase [Algoriphagus chordae]|uniref:Calcineurin-like phosphoesterase family protein n=1 Tax=Algoriphagus chordae TaxID=237019 RepID=A0A2W7R6Y1_9BACT|nr:metallophosphoesterase [Algoriphagus chordae]PZX49919.1 calcineurin-like phosphoesterase family protein [Algoriphagus chordae]
MRIAGRPSMKPYLLQVVAIVMLLCSCATKEPILKIGLVADPQYANKATAGKRYYRESLWKLEEAIDVFNNNKVDFVQNLGDIIDDDWGSYDSILPVYQKLDPQIENHQLLGNHEFSIDSSQMGNLLEKLSMPNYYYSYLKNGWRFIVLDATDYSFFSNSLHKHDIDQVNSYFELTSEKANNYRWNSAIGSEQQQWLKEQLDAAEKSNEKVILFSHMPLRPAENAHNLWNDNEIIKLIEGSSTVVAFINGHNHAGEYVLKNGIHYLTMFGMVDTEISSYGVLEIYTDSLVLKGYGNQENLVMQINKAPH